MGARAAAAPSGLRLADQRRLWELEEERTRAAYVAEPDDEPPPFDAASWEPLPYGGFDPPTKTRKKKGRR